MATRASILLNAFEKVPNLAIAQGDASTALTADAASDETIVVAVEVAPPLGSSENLYHRWYISRPNASAAEDKVRLVARYDPVNQGWRPAGGQYTNVPDGELIRILRDHPQSWNRALNYALRELLSYPRFDEFTPTSNTRRIYDVSAAPISLTDVTRATQVMNIQYHSTSDATNEERWRDYARAGRSWEPYEDEDTLYIEFSHALGTADEYRIISLQPFGEVYDETITTVDVDEEWAALATLMVMADWHGDLDNENDEWTKVGRKYKSRYEERRRAILGRWNKRQVSKVSQRAGGFRVGGRAGR